MGIFVRALKFRASVDRFRFRHSDDRGDQTRFKAFFDRATASETRCPSLFLFFHHPAPFPFISVTFDVSRAATFCIIQEADLRETSGLRDSVGTGVSISIGTTFWTLTHKTRWVALGHKTNANARKNDVFDFPRHIRLAALSRKFKNYKRENCQSISYRPPPPLLSLCPQTSSYAANFKPGFSNSTDR